MANALRVCLILFLAAASLAEEGITYGTSNFAADLSGPLDTRGNTWGRADAAVWFITFTPPTGSVVEIRSVEGDLVSWPTEKGLQSAEVETGRFAGVLFGLGNSNSGQGSLRADWLDDNTFLYVQDVIAQQGRRTRFAQVYEPCGVLLKADHKLLVKVAAWLNDTGRSIHLEPTFTLGYRFVRQEQCPTRTNQKPARSNIPCRLSGNSTSRKCSSSSSWPKGK